MNFEKIRRFLKKSKIVTKCIAQFVKKTSEFSIFWTKNVTKARNIPDIIGGVKIDENWIFRIPTFQADFRPKRKKFVEFNKKLKIQFSEIKLCQKRCDLKSHKLAFFNIYLFSLLTRGKLTQFTCKCQSGFAPLKYTCNLSKFSSRQQWKQINVENANLRHFQITPFLTQFDFWKLYFQHFVEFDKFLPFWTKICLKQKINTINFFASKFRNIENLKFIFKKFIFSFVGSRNFSIFWEQSKIQADT